MTWKFALPLLSSADVFAKNKTVLKKSLENSNYSFSHHLPPPRPSKKQFCWCDLKFWTALIITSWNFLKNMADFMNSIKNSHCPYYGEVTFPKNKAVLLMWLENLHLSLLSRAEILQKIRPCWWYYLKIRFIPTQIKPVV